MIYTTSGLENGIGLEIFLKALICFPQKTISQFILVTFKEDLVNTLDKTNISYSINETTLTLAKNKINCLFLESIRISKTVDLLDKAFSLIKNEDILLTLPSTKAEFNIYKPDINGHTDYLRDSFLNTNVSMNFISSTDSVLLLTEHIALEKVPETLTKSFILDKLRCSLNHWPKTLTVSEVILCGINPHCGEGGLISDKDSVLVECANILSKEYKNINFIHSIAADTAHILHKNSEQLFVFPSHDQGLAAFKQKNGTVGINLSLGLPFKRVSVDHGTAVELYGKNKANYQGMLYLIEEVLKW